MNCLLVTLFLHKPQLICLHRVKWFHILLFNTIIILLNIIYSFALNGPKYCYVILIILFNISHLLTHN